MSASGDLDLAFERARTGDSRGFDALFRAHAPSLVGYLRARGVSDPDDLANEVFVRAFRTIHTVQGDSNRFRSWLFAIAHNAAVDDSRRRRCPTRGVRRHASGPSSRARVHRRRIRARLSYARARRLTISPDPAPINESPNTIRARAPAPVRGSGPA